MKTLTWQQWRDIPQSNKVGDPNKGTAKVLTWVEGSGTCLVPVNVNG